MPPSTGDLFKLHPLGQERPAFNVNAPMKPRMKAIRERNASSPLFRLPLEVRMMIWKLVLGNKTVHISHWDQNIPARHVVCSSTVTESEAYQLSKNQEYENNASLRDSTEDMRYCRNRHKTCIDSMRGAIQDPSKMDISLLTLCCQTYTEINDTLWRTTTWSFFNYTSFSEWMEKRNTTQLKYLRRVHIQSAYFVWCGICVLNSCKVKTLESLQIETSGVPSLVQAGLDAVCPISTSLKTVEVIINRHGENDITWEEGVAVAEDIRGRLMAKKKDI